MSSAIERSSGAAAVPDGSDIRRLSHSFYEGWNDDDPNGNLVRYEDHLTVVAAAEKRGAEKERERIRKAVKALPTWAYNYGGNPPFTEHTEGGPWIIAHRVLTIIDEGARDTTSDHDQCATCGSFVHRMTSGRLVHSNVAAVGHEATLSPVDTLEKP